MWRVIQTKPCGSRSRHSRLIKGFFPTHLIHKLPWNFLGGVLINPEPVQIRLPGLSHQWNVMHSLVWLTGGSTMSHLWQLHTSDPHQNTFALNPASWQLAKHRRLNVLDYGLLWRYWWNLLRAKLLSSENTAHLADVISQLFAQLSFARSPPYSFTLPIRTSSVVNVSFFCGRPNDLSWALLQKICLHSSHC